MNASFIYGVHPMQTLKPELRTRVLAAAELEFAASGYAGATMAAIASRAEMSTGNLYRYFANKDALFEEIFTEEFAATFSRLVRKRVEALTVASDLGALDESARADASAMLGFFIENRTRVIVLLDRAGGSIHEGFRARFVDELVRPSLAKLGAESGGRRISKEARLVLTTIFENTVRMIVAILESSSDEAVIATSFAGFWSYQLAGLAGFTRWVSS